MTLAHDTARRQRRRDAANRSRDRRNRHGLTITEARTAWWHRWGRA